MKYKFSILLLGLMFSTGLVAAQGNQASDIPDEAGDFTELPDRPSTAPNKGVSGSVGNAISFLPETASSTAKNVLNTIVDVPSAQIGEALQGLFEVNNSTDSQ